MAIVMQDGVRKLIEGCHERGFDLGFGVGSGDATLGHIGSTEQFHYTAIASRCLPPAGRSLRLATFRQQHRMTALGHEETAGDATPNVRVNGKRTLTEAPIEDTCLS